MAILLTVTLFDQQGAQLCGPAMVKTDGAHTLSRVANCFCLWAQVDPATVAWTWPSGDASDTVQQAGLSSGNAINAVLAQGSPPPAASAAAAPFTMLDVVDSEVAAMAGSLGVSST